MMKKDENPKDAIAREKFDELNRTILGDLIAEFHANIAKMGLFEAAQSFAQCQIEEVIKEKKYTAEAQVIALAHYCALLANAIPRTPGLERLCNRENSQPIVAIDEITPGYQEKAIQYFIDSAHRKIASGKTAKDAALQLAACTIEQMHNIGAENGIAYLALFATECALRLPRPKEEDVKKFQSELDEECNK